MRIVALLRANALDLSAVETVVLDEGQLRIHLHIQEVACVLLMMGVYG